MTSSALHRLGRPFGLIVLASALLLAGCASDGGSETPAEAATDETAAATESPSPEPGETYEQATVRLALHFNSPQASWIGIYVAEEEGYYADLGIDLEIQYLGGSTLAVQAVGAGRADIGLAAPDAVIAGVRQDLPLISVANHIQQDSTGVIVNGEASEFADLAGLTIATAQGTAESGMFQAALVNAGVVDDVQVDYVESAAKCSMMIAGQADACTGFSYSQLVQAQLNGLDPSFLPFSTDEVPLPGAMIFATDSFVADSSDVVERFLQATFEGYAAADADREMAIALMGELNDTTDPEQLEISTGMVLDLTHSTRTEADGWGWMTDEVWENLMSQLVAGGVLDEAVDPAALYTNDLLPASAQAWQ